MAQTIRLKRSAVAGRIPTINDLDLGEVAINTVDGKMYIKKSVEGFESIIEIGAGGGVSGAVGFKSYSFTAVDGQTAFSGLDDDGYNLEYNTSAIEVYVNGVLLVPDVDYTATNGFVVTLTDPTDVDDVLQVATYTAISGNDNIAVNTFTGDGVTDTFTFSVTPDTHASTFVYIDGAYQNKTSYSIVDNDLVLSAPPASGSTIEVVLGSRTIELTQTDINVASVVTPSLQITGGTAEQGVISWNSEDETLDLVVSPDVTYQIGQELGLVARNLSGTTLENGSVVRVTGASGNKVTIDLADCSGEYSSAPTVGVVTETINNNSTGRITTAGLVRGLNTSSFTEGAAIYLSTNGTFTTTKPASPNHLVHIGWIVRSHAAEGAILVHVNNGWELDELHDVLIDTPTEGQGILWNSALGLWENKDIDAFPDQTGEANNYLMTDGTNVSWQRVFSGIHFVHKTADYTVNIQEGVIADTSGGSFTVTLPVSPVAGDTVVIADGASFLLNTLTVARNGETISGDAEDFIIDIEGVSVTFIYDGSTWQVYSQVGNLSPQIASTTRNVFTATAGQTTFSAIYDIGFVDVFFNGAKLVDGVDFVANDENTVVLTAPADAGDIVEIDCIATLSIADTLSQAQMDMRYIQQADVLSPDEADTLYYRKEDTLSAAQSDARYSQIEDVYTKVESDSNYYTKTEVDNLLNPPAEEFVGEWTVTSTNITAGHSAKILALQPITVSLPAYPVTLGDVVIISNKSNGILTINRNGSLMEGQGEDGTLLQNTATQLVYSGNEFGWMEI